MLYRVLRTLDKGKGKTLSRGSITSFVWLIEKQIALLLDKRVISRIAAPPLIVLPGWEKRAEKVRHLGIIFVTEFLETNDVILAEALGEESDTITRWKAEARAWLKVDPPKKKKH